MSSSEIPQLMLDLNFSDTDEYAGNEVLELGFDYRKLVNTTGVWRNADRLTSQLRQRLLIAKKSASALNSFDAIEFFDSSAAVLLLEFLSGQNVAETKVSRTFRDRALRMTIGWLEATNEFPLTVMELCQKTGFSAPTMYRAFMDEFGIGPKRYLQVRRLTEVRRDLKSEYAEQGITDIANRWGFWHMGTFAAEYKMQFGELPSDTSRKLY